MGQAKASQREMHCKSRQAGGRARLLRVRGRVVQHVQPAQPQQVHHKDEGIESNRPAKEQPARLQLAREPRGAVGAKVGVGAQLDKRVVARQDLADGDVRVGLRVGILGAGADGGEQRAVQRHRRQRPPHRHVGVAARGERGVHRERPAGRLHESAALGAAHVPNPLVDGCGEGDCAKNEMRASEGRRV